LRGRQFNAQRDHVIPDADLRAIWAVAAGFDYPFGPLITGLTLTGLRLSELAEAQWSEIDDDLDCLVVPSERMKNKQAHALPLTPRMHELLDAVPKFTRGDYLFSTTFGQKPIAGFAKLKKRFDKEVSTIREVEPWRLHDIRRTVRTNLSRAGVQVFTAELIIAHQQSGIHAMSRIPLRPGAQNVVAGRAGSY
jgi:integrase